METHEVAEQPQLLRKQIFKNLNKVLNEISYEELPAEKIIAHKVETKDKTYQIKCTTDKDVVHTLGKRGSKNVLKNEPGPEGAGKRVQTPL